MDGSILRFLLLGKILDLQSVFFFCRGVVLWHNGLFLGFCFYLARYLYWDHYHPDVLRFTCFCHVHWNFAPFPWFLRSGLSEARLFACIQGLFLVGLYFKDFVAAGEGRSDGLLEDLKHFG